MLRWISSLSILAMCLAGCSVPKKSLPENEGELHLFLLAGQSNMAGRGAVAASNREPIPGVWALQKDGSWAAAVDPIHWDKPIVGVGLARSFARDYLTANPGVEIGFIPAACGGSPVESWKPGAFFEQTRSFPYDDALARVRAVRGRGILKGILWHQGESDSRPERSFDYETRLMELFARFRRDLDAPELPVLVGQLGRFPGKEWTADRVKVDSAHRAIAERDPNIGFVSSEGLGAKEDLVHFDTEALEAFGRRYAAAWQRLQSIRGR